MASGTLDITSNTIRFGERIYAVRNITQINLEVWKRKPRLSWRVIGVSAGLGLICWYFPDVPVAMYVAVMAKLPWPALPDLLAAGFGLAAAYGVWERSKLKFYTLLIETSGSSASLFSSRDKRVVKDAALKIHQVMEERDTALSYHLSVGDVIHNSGKDAIIISKSQL